MHKQRIAIIGSGVSGLTSALLLTERGFSVDIFAREFPPHTTSNVAAAWWFFYKAAPADKVLKWGIRSLEKFKELYAQKDSGVFPIEFVELLQPEDQVPTWGPLSENHGPLPTSQLPPSYTKAYCGTVPVADSSHYLPFLVSQLEKLGVRRIQREIARPEDLSDYSMVVNCAGAWSGNISADKASFPIRGQALRLSKPSITARCWADGNSARAPLFIVPRLNDYVVGGTADVGEWDNSPREEVSQLIMQKVCSIEPALANCRILEVAVGIRPGRSAVRVERELKSNGTVVIHNYGHGGSGFALSWGCAEEVCTLAAEV